MSDAVGLYVSAGLCLAVWLMTFKGRELAKIMEGRLPPMPVIVTLGMAGALAVVIVLWPVFLGALTWSAWVDRRESDNER